RAARPRHLRVRHVPQSPAHALRLVQPLRRRLLRSLRAPVLDGRVDRLPAALMRRPYSTAEQAENVEKNAKRGASGRSCSVTWMSSRASWIFVVPWAVEWSTRHTNTTSW